jgi:predicted nucleotidyltransferase
LAAAAILAAADQEGAGSMKHQFANFIDDLRATHKGNLVSVILFGSAAAGDFIQHESDYNILVATNKIGPEDLRNAQATTRVARKVLFGPDVLADLNISDKFLRLQAEYELRSKLIQLRRQYIPASASVEGLKSLMADSLSSFAALFRAVLILKGLTPPATKHEIVALTAKELGIEGSPFEKIFNIRKNNFTDNLDEVAANRLFGEYMEQIEKVIDVVDAIGK